MAVSPARRLLLGGNLASLAPMFSCDSSLLLPPCSPSSSIVCAGCAEDYSLGLGYTCSECDEGRRKWTTALAVILLAAAAVAVTLSVGYLGASTKESATEGILSLIQERFGRSWVSQGLKVIIVSWQIVSQASGCSTQTRRISTHDPKFMKLWNTCSVGLLKRLHLLKLFARPLEVLGSTIRFLFLTFPAKRVRQWLSLRRYVPVITSNGNDATRPKIGNKIPISVTRRDFECIASPEWDCAFFFVSSNTPASLLPSGG